MRGNITRRGKSSWQLKYDAGKKANGKRDTRYATVKGSYKEAQKELTRLLGSADDDTLPDPTKATVSDYVRAWLDSSLGLSPKTLERYRELAEHQIIPHLGAEKLQKLKPEMIRTWHGALMKSLSAQTVHHAHRLLRQVLACAVKDRKLTVNVADVHSPPKITTRKPEILKELDQIEAVQQALRGHTLYPIVALALGTGMRRGELLGLQWGDVTLDKVEGHGKIRVGRSLEETQAGLRLKEPKSDAGWRTITLSTATVAMLRAHKASTLRIRLKLGMGNISPETLVFSDVEGEPLKPHTVSRAWRRVVETKKLPKVTFHALRHTHASILINEGVDILTISRRIGHSKPSVTLDVYGHLLGGADEAAAKAITKVLK